MPQERPDFRTDTIGVYPRGRREDPYKDLFPSDRAGGITGKNFEREPLGGNEIWRNRGEVAPYQPTVTENDPGGPNDNPLKKLLGGAGGADILGLLSLLLGGLKQGSGQDTVNTSTTDPALQKVLDIMSGRLNKSEPIYDSVMAMTNGLLPTQYQRANPLLGNPTATTTTTSTGRNPNGLGPVGRDDETFGKRG